MKYLKTILVLGLLFSIVIVLGFVIKSQRISGFSEKPYNDDITIENNFLKPEKIVVEYIKLSQEGKFEEIERLIVNRHSTENRNDTREGLHILEDNSTQDSKSSKSEVPYSSLLNESDHKFMFLENPRYIKGNKLEIEKYSTKQGNKNQFQVIVDFVNENRLYMATQTFFLQKDKRKNWKIVKIVFGEDNG